MKRWMVAVVLAGLSMTLLGTGAALAQPSSSGKHFNKNGVSFSYPSGWKTLPKGQQSQMVSGFNTDPSAFSVAGAGGVFKKVKKKGGVALFIKLGFTSKFQKALHSHESLFFQKTVDSIAKQGKHVKTGSGTFGGRPGKWVELTTKGSSPTHSWIAVSLAKNDKFGQMAVLVAVPPSSWSKYSHDLLTMAHGAQFH